MARPKLPESERRLTLSLRIEPSLRADLEQRARENGSSLTTEIIERLTLFSKSNPDDLLLLGSMAHHMAGIQAMAGKSWREDMPTYLAMLRFINQVVTEEDPSRGVGEMGEVRARLSEVLSAKRKVRDQLLARGIQTHPMANPTGRYRWSRPEPPRYYERLEISKLDDTGDREDASKLHEQLCVLDAQEAEVTKRRDDLGFAMMDESEPVFRAYRDQVLRSLRQPIEPEDL